MIMDSKQSADQTKILNAKQGATCSKQAADDYNWRPTITTGVGRNLVTKFETNVQISHGTINMHIQNEHNTQKKLKQNSKVECTKTIEDEKGDDVHLALPMT